MATFTANRKDLLNRVRMAGKVSPSRSPRAILQNIHVTVNGRVDLTTTDQEIGLVQSADYERSGDAETLVNAKQLIGLLGKVKADEVTVTVETDSFQVTTGKAKFTLPVNDLVQDFPPVTTDRPAVATAYVSAADLEKLIRQTEYAADTESTRYAIGGILIELSANKVTCVATDTRRLAYWTTAAVTLDDVDRSGVVPISAIKAVADQLKTTKGNVCIDFSGGDVETTHVRFSTPDWVVDSRLVEGRFPRYQDVIPQNCESIVTLGVAEVAEGLQTAMIAASDEERSCVLSFDVDGTLRLCCKSPENGQADVSVSATYQLGRIKPAMYDPRFILAYLKSLDKNTETVDLKLIDHTSAAVLAADGQASCVVMPLSTER